jgi:hypothetical protein|tara:strand:- start:970 stop:1356 length:387 start_codon:yes stop_codon:yes gene_type:complete
VQFSFEKQFGKGTDPWYSKAERWAKKKFKNPYLQHLALGFIEWLKQKWIDVKIANNMKEIDIQSEQIKKIWEEQDDRREPDIVETGVFGDEGWSIQITNPVVERGTSPTSTGMATGSDAPRLQEDEGN